MAHASHTPATRDAAIRRLARARRWLLAGATAATAALTALAADAFPGAKVDAGASGSSKRGSTRATPTRPKSGTETPDPPLQAPSEEPRAATAEGGSSGSAASEPAQQSSPAQTGPAEGTGAQAAAPSSSASGESVSETPATTQPEAAAPSTESPQAPVVSGGS